jgi:hypothetical protein
MDVLVMQQPSVAYAIHDVYMTIMSIPRLPHGCLESRIEGGKMHMRMHIHTACYPFHTRECAAIVITSLRAYELRQPQRGSHEQFRY